MLQRFHGSSNPYFTLSWILIAGSLLNSRRSDDCLEYSSSPLSFPCRIPLPIFTGSVCFTRHIHLLNPRMKCSREPIVSRDLAIPIHLFFRQEAICPPLTSPNDEPLEIVCRGPQMFNFNVYVLQVTNRMNPFVLYAVPTLRLPPLET